MTPIFSAPTEDDFRLLESHWAAIKKLAEEEFGYELDESIATLDLLQKIVDQELVNHEGQQAVGTVLGRVMAHHIPGLDWWAVVDEFGRGLCLRYEETTLRANPMTMVARRVGYNERVDILELFNSTREKIEPINRISD